MILSVNCNSTNNHIEKKNVYFSHLLGNRKKIEIKMNKPLVKSKYKISLQLYKNAKFLKPNY